MNSDGRPLISGASFASQIADGGGAVIDAVQRVSSSSKWVKTCLIDAEVSMTLVRAARCGGVSMLHSDVGKPKVSARMPLSGRRSSRISPAGFVIQ